MSLIVYKVFAYHDIFRYEPGRGRYAVASRDVDVGEFICVENPIVSHMLPDYMGSNCTHCFKFLSDV